MTALTRTDRLGFLEGELKDLYEQGFVWRPRILEGEQRARARFDGQEVVNLSSNNYLGLTNHPRLRESAKRAIDRYGAGAGAVRPIAGTMTLHRELEEKLARFKGVEATLVFQSGFAANLGAIQTLMGKGDAIYSEELNHGSIIDGCRLSGSEILRWPHRNADALRRLCKESRQKYRRALLVTDAVFSMDGDIAPLKELASIAEEFDLIFMVDDAHASGVLGRGGRGSADHFGLHGRVDLQMGTLSKALGAMGGYIAGSKNLIEFLIQKARPWLLSTAHPPAVVAAAIASVEILESPEGERLVAKLWENANYFKQELKKLGFNTGASETPITPVIVGSSQNAKELARRLFAEGVFAQEIVFPMVAREKARVRTIVTAMHTKEDLDFALNAFKKVGKELELM
ncbi:glycine C-acetyltransferase [Candidatus Acetothermia bacterium]|jgi:glycine C-acetyltransferase|nr:glycine C-acetyltransferase [Candidatus Acetothermia bacterium]MCI2431635.1 glycine C-acetyltransferase [Candidatus Acetothermia bacterium]MCI2437183.1 glycine C-acetyltransferase [Candidatus Acetothermia bacterium]